MELESIIDFLKKYKLLLVSGILVGALIGALVFYYYPQKYVAVGSLFITRGTEALPSPENSEDVFTYEGYYSQQNAQSYTTTVVGLLESTDIKSSVLQQKQVPVTEQSLRRLGNSISTKKIAPQLVELNVKSYSPAEASDTWVLLSDEVISTSSQLNSKGDPNLTVEKVTSEPVVRETYRNIFVSIFAGASLGFLVSLLIAVLHNALDATKTSKKKSSK